MVRGHTIINTAEYATLELGQQFRFLIRSAPVI